jgi:hypothetical protein
MSIQTANNKMEAIVNERLRLQRAYSAANSMMLQLQIPEGNHLLFALDQPQARDNKDAICHWLLVQNKWQLIDQSSYVELRGKLRSVLSDFAPGDYS